MGGQCHHGQLDNSTGHITTIYSLNFNDNCGQEHTSTTKCLLWPRCKKKTGMVIKKESAQYNYTNGWEVYCQD